MQKNSRSFTHLTDEQLIDQVKLLAVREREVTAQLIASLAELDARGLYLGEGFSSLFTCCTQCLHLSEHAAYSRITAARVARRLPIVLEKLSDGSVTLTTVVLLAPHLTPENHRAVLEAASHRSRREVEQQLAALRPLPSVATIVRKLPPAPLVGVSCSAVTILEARSAASESVISSGRDVRPTAPRDSVPPASRPAVIAPLAPERFKLQLTISRETHDKLRRVQDLLRHSVPSGDPAEILDRALTLLLADLERRKLALTKHPRQASDPRAGSRHVPAVVRREVWQRDEGRCAFVGTMGRCGERGFLEFHHVVPFAEGGETTTTNLQLRCRAHNQYEAKGLFGSAFLRERQIAYEHSSREALFG